MKVDAAAIEQHMRALARQPWLGAGRSAWPLHLFRIDDVRAAADVLNCGAIYSRRNAERLGVLGHDSANATVIEHSPEWCKECVRLYFRPKTPTEHESEGFRPSAGFSWGAHRPMPVVFVFDAIAILTSDTTVFTDGNAGHRRHQRGSDAAFLKQIPFENVYHTGAFPSGERDEIVFRRCAEVLVPDRLPLTHLKHVFCRSQAEYETLFSLLDPTARTNHGKKVGVSASLHYKKWTFLESVDLSTAKIRLRFSPSTLSPGPFRTHMDIFDEHGRLRGAWHDESFMAKGEQVIGLTQLGLTGYRVTLTLDGNLAYQNSFAAAATLL
jgi:hypothetical protein